MTSKDWDMETIYNDALNAMEENLIAKTQSDEIYKFDDKCEQELDRRYCSLRLTTQYRRVINDYHACTNSKTIRALELAYIAGVEAVLKIINEQSEPQNH